MAYIGYNEIWRSEFYNNVCAKDRVQDINLNQGKLKVNGTYKKGGKITTIFESSSDEEVLNRGYLDAVLSKGEGQSLLSYVEKEYNE